MHTKNTKIICTLGPATDSVSEIENLVKAGMNVARLNFSHGTYPHHLKMMKNLRLVEKKTGKRIGLLQDLQGPKIRVGEMPAEGVKLKKGQKIILTTKHLTGNEKTIPIQYKNFIKDIKPKHSVLINDGLVELKVLKVDRSKNQAVCVVRNSGIIKSHNGMNLPNTKTSIKSLSEKDKADLAFGLKNGIDFVALSFVRSVKDIKELRALIKNSRKNVPIIAKIETPDAVKNLKPIIKEADGVMVARGDLGIEIPAEKVPIVQKRIIHLANKYGKPVITATQVLASMTENPRATRAEISDAANAVFDHTDAIMLSNETSTGKYPFRATSTLTKVINAVEYEIKSHDELIENIWAQAAISQTKAACLSACELARDISADFIVVYTREGYTAKQTAKHRPYTPIITITPSEKTARELTLTWGINTTLIKSLPQSSNQTIKNIVELLKSKKLIKKGNKLVIVFSSSPKEKMITSLKV
ncbi:MAG: pyruvate kinase [Candidatus Gracilibacteria bacterium]|jgi:pyruvate kinase